MSKGGPSYVELIRDREKRYAGTVKEFTRRAADGSVESAGKPQVINKMGVRGAVWTYKVGRNSTTKDHNTLLAHPCSSGTDGRGSHRFVELPR